MKEKIETLSPRLTLVGVVLLLVGLMWDAALHSADPELASEEGIFTLTNPGHVLFGLGLALAVAGSMAFLAGRFQTSRAGLRARLLAVGPVAGLAALGIISFASVMSVEGGIGGGHSHESGEQVADSSHSLERESGEVADSSINEAHSHDANEEAVALDDEAANADAEEDAHSHDDGSEATEEEQAAADELLANVRSAAQRFNSFETAVAEGYVQSTPFALGDHGPAHFINPAYYRDDRLLEPDYPESLVYFKLRDGGMLLLGVMFLAPPGEGPTPGGPITAWHTHEDACFGANGLVVLESPSDSCPAGTRRISEQSEMMHVWLFDGPSGPFGHRLTREDFVVAAQQLLQ